MYKTEDCGVEIISDQDAAGSFAAPQASFFAGTQPQKSVDKRMYVQPYSQGTEGMALWWILQASIGIMPTRTSVSPTVSLSRTLNRSFTARCRCFPICPIRTGKNGFMPSARPPPGA